MTQYRSKGALGVVSKNSVQVARVNAPLKGVDTRVGSSEGDPFNCVYAFNMIPSEQDVKVRKGYREHAVGLITDGGISDGVHTVMPFNSADPVARPDKIFATTNEGIWDVTAYDSPPILALAFADQSAGIGCGYGTSIHYTNDAERDVLIYADEVNGAFEYDASTDTWAVPVGLVDPTPDTVRFVMLHKDRIWLLVRGSSTMYYLDSGSTGGTATPFHMGGKFTHGGAIAGAFSWSVDSGNGLDSMLVVVSTAGDVIVYVGDDPNAADGSWRSIGQYYIGEVPVGGTFGTQHGGNLYLLSAYGLNSMNGLLKGVNAEEMLATADNTSSTNKITAVIRAAMLVSIAHWGWEVRIAPTEGALVVNTPETDDYNGYRPRTQYVFSVTMSAWGFWRDLPMGAFNTWRDSIIFGTHDSRIVIMDVAVDNAVLHPSVPDEDNGYDIYFSLLTSFQSYGTAAQFKRVSLIRPDFIASQMPSYQVRPVYDYRIDEITANVQPAKINDPAQWDISLWDADRWSVGLPHGQNRVSGAFGYGRYVAMSLFGRTRERTVLAGFDVMYKVGSPLI